jgi:hypothetical protein
VQLAVSFSCPTHSTDAPESYGQGSGIGARDCSKVCWKGRLLLSMLAVTARGPIAQGSKSTVKPPSLSLASPSPAPPPPATATCRCKRLASTLRSPRASSRLVACPISAAPMRSSSFGRRSESRARPQRAQLSSSGPCLRLRALDRPNTKPRGAGPHDSCARSPAGPSVRETIRLGMSESTRDQRMSPHLAPVAFVDLTVPRATWASPPRKARPWRTTVRARRRRGRTLTEKEGAVVGAEAGERARVGMASSGASAESAGARGKRQWG